jgi:hypothetical protein
MHHTRYAIARLRSEPQPIPTERLRAVKEFAIGWLAGLIFFGTLLS